MLFKTKTYLKFLWYSKNEHAVHSPFVFNLITKCFYDKKHKNEYDILKLHRKFLKKNLNTILVNDFGEDSSILKSNSRSINQIAQTVCISKKRAELLFRIVNYFQPESSDNKLSKQSILDISSSLSIAATALALGNPKAKITTLAGCSETANEFQLQLQKNSINNLDLVITGFDNYFENSNLKFKTFSLIYFNNSHSKTTTLKYFELLLPTISNNTLWIFDGIHWSSELEKAWESIKNHPKVSVTIDTLQWGLVFFRKEQPKEHFVIRV